MVPIVVAHAVVLPQTADPSPRVHGVVARAESEFAVALTEAEALLRRQVEPDLAEFLAQVQGAVLCRYPVVTVH